MSKLLPALTGSWAPRFMWLAVSIAGALSIGNAVDGRSSALRTTVMVAAWIVWGVGVVALAVPSTLGLTVMRMVSALACGVAIVSWASGAHVAVGVVFVACTMLSGLLIGGADFGQRSVQASAYGDEQRYLLRPPAAFVLPVALAGVVWTSTVIAALLLLAAGLWAAGFAVAVVAASATWLLVPRFNVLSRRWLVLVPAGVVVHDQVVLAETLMVSRADLAGIDLALADTEAADFTGPAAGHAVEVSMRSMVTAVRAPTKAAPRGVALHVQSFIVAPSRPGAVLRATHS
ncbi:MAG: hypothetical protein ABI862_05510 [Ilumatobacteraceae bacterium]